MSPPLPDPPERRYGTRPEAGRKPPAGLSGFVVGDKDEASSGSSNSNAAKPRPKPRPYDRAAHSTDEDDDPALPSARISRQRAADEEEIQMMMDEELGPRKNSTPSGSSSLLKVSSISKSKSPFKSFAQKSAPLKKKPSSSNLKAVALGLNPKITDTFKPRSVSTPSSSSMGPPVAPRLSSSNGTSAQTSRSDDRSDDEEEAPPGDDPENPIQVDDINDSDSQASIPHKRKDVTPEGALKSALTVWQKAHDNAQAKNEAEANGDDWKAATGKKPSAVYLGFDRPFIGTKHDQHCILFPCRCCAPPQNIHRPFNDSSTSNLHSHVRQLKNKANNQLSIMEMFSKKATPSSAPAILLSPSVTRQMMVAWISESGRPISIVEDRGFLAFFSEEQQALMPSRFTISRDVARVFFGMTKYLKEELAAVEGCFHLATDVWTSANGYSFLGLIICYQQNGRAIRRLLEMVPFLTTHDSEHLANATFRILEKYGITKRLWNIVSDNASENTKMMRLLAAKDGLPRFITNEDGQIGCRVRCTAHVLNLISKAVLSGFGRSRKTKNQQTETAAGEDEMDSAGDQEKDDWDEDDELGGEDAACDDRAGDEDEDECQEGDDDDTRAVEDEEDLEISTSLNPQETAVEEDEEDVQQVLDSVPTKLSARQTLELQMRNKEIGTALRKLAWLAQQFRYSPVKRRSFHKQCERLSCKAPYTIVRDVATRWNSTLDMIESGLRLWKGIIAYTEREDTPIPKDKRLKRTDEDDLRKLFDFLKPISDATL
ncbi:hypothetical protein CF326_g8546, partial [Tilletia indica]